LVEYTKICRVAWLAAIHHPAPECFDADTQFGRKPLWCFPQI